MHSHPIKIPPLIYAKPRLRHYLEYLPFRGFSFILQILPLPFALFLARRLSDLARLILRDKTSQTLTIIKDKLSCDQAKARSVLKSSYHNFAENWVQLCRSPHLHRDVPALNADVLKLLAHAKEQQRGIVFATGHFSWWEYVPKILFYNQLPVAITVAVQHNPLFDRFINHRRTCFGFHTILHNRIGIRHTFDYLKKGGILIILADVDVREKGIPVPFMGQLASTPKWPAELALRTDSILCNTRLKRTPAHFFEIEISESIDPRDYQHIDNPTYAMSSKMNEHFSTYIHDTPEQWFWLQRRWKTVFPNET